MTIATGVLLAALGVSRASAEAPSPRAELKAAVEKLREDPDDKALREKIIKLAKAVKPAPTVPEEARRHFVMAVTMQKKAKSAAGARAAIEEYEQALLIAPWWPEAYYNLSLAAEAASQYKRATVALELYLATGPKAAEARQARDRMYELEAQRKLSAEQDAAAASEREARAAAARDKFASTIAGRWEKGGMGFEVSKAGAGVEVSCMLLDSNCGGIRSYPAEKIRLGSDALHFECTDCYGVGYVYDCVMEDDGRLKATVQNLFRGEPARGMNGESIKPDVVEYTR